jgi:transposase
MAKVFRPFDPEQQLLLPPSLNDWLPEDHLARFVEDLLRRLDLSAITSPYEEEERGYPPYHPVMMTQVLLYGYAVGIYSGRRLAKALETDVAFRYLAAQNRPGHRTIIRFRREHRVALGKLFSQVLDACRAAGLVKLGTVAIDGTKIKANASKHKAMSHKRMLERKDEYTKAIKEWFDRADREDDDDDRRLGADKRGDELPDHLRTKQKRLEKINEALEALKREAEEQAAEDGKDPAETRVADKAQKNFTDPDSKILKTGDGFVQGYNAQAAVDTESQVIVAHDIFADGSDQLHLAEMVEKVVEETGQVPERVAADAGYYSEEGVREIEAIGTEAFIATARSKHEEPQPAPRGRPPEDLTAKQKMRRKLLTKRGKKVYARRKTSVEPVFGQVKQGRGFRAFLMRGLGLVAKEWAMVCTAHNIVKLWRAQWAGGRA